MSDLQEKDLQEANSKEKNNKLIKCMLFDAIFGSIIVMIFFMFVAYLTTDAFQMRKDFLIEQNIIDKNETIEVMANYDVIYVNGILTDKNNIDLSGVNGATYKEQDNVLFINTK